jgi:outer membrane receptor protein involved in Fe transport
VLVLVDEVPINELEGDRVDWNLLDLAQVDRIEFLRGPATFLYGNESMAGVVNVVTRRAAPGTSAWLEAGGGSEGRASASGGAGLQRGTTDAAASGSYRTLDGFRDHSAFHSAGGYGTLRGTWLGLDAAARVLVQRTEQEVPGPLPDPLWRDDPKQTQTPTDRRDQTVVSGALQLAGRPAEGFEVVSQLSGESRDIDATETIVPVGTLDRSGDQASLRAELRGHWQPSGWPIPHLMVGGEIERGALESRYFDPATSVRVGAGDVTRLTGAGFALLVVRPHERLQVTGGLRGDWLRSSLDDPSDGQPRRPDDDLRAISPTAALNWTLPGAGNAYFTYSGAFKAPGLEQLYDRRPYFVDFDGPGPLPPVPLLISNNALQPQRGDHFDLGVRASPLRGVGVDAAAYLARSRGEIGFDLANFRYSNIDRSKHVGFEGGVRVDRGPASGQVSYAYTEATFDGGAHDGHQINTVPKHQVFARASYRHAWRGSVTASLTHVRDQWIDEDNRYPLPDYTVWDLAATQSVAGLELFGAVRNLFDQDYATLGFVTIDQVGADLPLYFPAEGRSVQLGMRLRVGGGGAP